MSTLLLISLLISLSAAETEEVLKHLQRANAALTENEVNLEYRVHERTLELRIANEKLLEEAFERGRAEDALRDSEARFRALFEDARDGMVLTDQINGIVLDCNNALLKMVSRNREDVIGRPQSNLHHSAEADGLFSTHYDRVDAELMLDARLLTGGGNILPVEIKSTLLNLQGQNVIYGIFRDITQRKKLEERLEKANTLLESRVEKRTLQLRKSRDQLRKLARQLVSAQEQERRRVALELHDDAGQALIALQLSLNTIYDELPVSLRKIRQRMKKAIGTAEQMIGQIRTLAYSLRPPLLDVMGFNHGVQSLCEEFYDQTGIRVEYVGVDLPHTQDEINISLYRFVQEALTNIAKHAHAAKARVSIEHKDGHIRASVQDDGQGFKLNPRVEGLGLTGIQERLGLLGGKLEIRSTKGRGTHMIASVPLK